VIVMMKLKWLFAVVEFVVKVGCRLLWGFLEGICSDHGELCSIVVSVVRV